MKNYSIIILSFISLVSILLTIFLSLQISTMKETLNDREQVISTYIKVIDAIGRTNNIEINQLKKELEKDFELNKYAYECCDDGFFYHTLLDKNQEDLRISGKYMGGVELITDSTNKFISVMMYKP